MSTDPCLDASWADRKEEVSDEEGNEDEARYGKKVQAGFGFSRADDATMSLRKVTTQLFLLLRVHCSYKFQLVQDVF